LRLIELGESNAEGKREKESEQHLNTETGDAQLL
jgi:hypothetical protein